MAGERAERRLAAILAGDVAGYSRMMGIDEEGTLARLNAHRREFLDPQISEHRGRIVKRTGDGVLVEFGSAVDAARCAVAIQRGMAGRNAQIPQDKRIELRVGIHVGDIIIEDNDIFGDGVNIAARLENIATPGGICISGDAYRQVRGKLEADFHDEGEQELKNLTEPVHVYRIQVAQVRARPISALPDKPSIAVLPFTNMSGDIEQEYFADGISEDIITALARVRQFFVIARNTTFTYKGRSVDVQAVAKDLGVRYVLEGSVRRAGNRVRITAQLIEGATGNHVWADRYDRELKDIFAVQDEITQTVVGALGPELTRAEQERARSKPPSSLGAWDYYQRGLWHFHHFDKAGTLEAIEFFRKAVSLDPSFSSALAELSYAHSTNFIRGYADDRAAELEAAYTTAVRAVAAGKEDALAHWALGMAFNFKRDHASALSRLEHALELNPSFAQAHSQYGLVLCFCGRPQEAFSHFDQAQRISPRDPFGWLAWFGRGWAHFFLGQFDQAITSAKKTIEQAPEHVWNYVILLAAYACSNQSEAAKEALRDLMAVKSDFSISFAKQTGPFDKTRLEILTEALQKAGVPD